MPSDNNERGGSIQTSFCLFVPCGLRALRSYQVAGATCRTTSAALIRPLDAKYKKAPHSAVRLIGFGVYVVGRKHPNKLLLVCPLRASRFALVSSCCATCRTTSAALIQPLGRQIKKPRISEAFVFGAQRRNRTTDTRIFNRKSDHILLTINMLHA